MTITSEILDGLNLPKKVIQSKYLYDERGSALFEKICHLPEYYLTRAEQEILKEHVHAIAHLLDGKSGLFEFGSGSSLKTRLLLKNIHGHCIYVPIDISKEILFQEARRLSIEFPDLKILPVCADFTKIVHLPNKLTRGLSTRVLFFPGSTIGNFEPVDAVTLLRHILSLIGNQEEDHPGHLIVGIDLIKDPRKLEAAYNDSQGVTAAFNMNLLTRLNKECQTNFDPRGFKHHAFFNSQKNRIEMHLVSLREQSIQIAGQSVRFQQGETIHTENSYKYDHSTFIHLLEQAGFSKIERWTDAHELFAVYHAA